MRPTDRSSRSGDIDVKENSSWDTVYEWPIQNGTGLMRQFRQKRFTENIESEKIISKFGTAWSVLVSPKGLTEQDRGYISVHLNWQQIPSHISKIKVKYEIAMPCFAVDIKNTAVFDPNEYMAWGGAGLRVKYNETLDKDRLNFIVKWKILEVSYSEGYALEQVKTDVNAMESRMVDSIKEEMDTLIANMLGKISTLQSNFQLEMQKMNKRFDTIEANHNKKKQKQKKFKKINKSKAELEFEFEFPNESPYACKLREWICNDLKLPEYYLMFVKHGFDSVDFSALFELNNSDLKKYGILKHAHRLAILKSLRDIKETEIQSPENIEGSDLSL